jgi:uncharacterized protein YndB with AHSA1/START domain
MNRGRTVEEVAVMFERDLPASPEKAWAFLTEPSRLAGWYGEAVIEPCEGGKIALMDGLVRGVVTGWRPHQFFAHSWNVLHPGERVSKWPISYLEFALTAQGDTTCLTLMHRPIPAPMRTQTVMGWHTFLDMLEAGIGGGEVQARDHYMKTNAALYGVDLDNLQR